MTREDEMKEAAAAAFEESETPQDKFRNHCMSRGYNGIILIARLFRIADNDASGSLSTDEFCSCVSNSGIELSEEEITGLTQELDADGEGTINYEEFLNAIRPEMNEVRLGVVEEAFASLDTSGDGTVTLDDLREKYKLDNHPSVVDGTMSADEVLARFMGRLEGVTSTDGQISKQEFIDYYSGVSNSIDDDEYFVHILKNAYGL